ncbi:nucleoside triphosphate pyrophosphatase [Colwelliaceae bacterium BS250]
MLYLASKSPRRKELLSQIGIQFELVSADINESPKNDEKPLEFVTRMAIEKAEAGWHNLANPANNQMVLGSDTIVVCNEQILGKPTDFADAQQMLNMLSDSQHQVITAVAIKTFADIDHQAVTTNVTFRAISNAEINAYWQSGEPQDKAGSYGIQGVAGKFVTNIVGSYSAVVGLPLYETEQLLIKTKIKLNEGVL